MLTPINLNTGTGMLRKQQSMDILLPSQLPPIPGGSGNNCITENVGKGESMTVPLMSLYNKIDFQEIVINSDGVNITFLVENRELFSTPEETGKLIVIADLICRLNPYVHGAPLLKVRILDTKEYRGEYIPSMHEIVLSKNVFCESDFLHTIAHEMGHAVELSISKDKELVNKLYIYSLGFGRYSLVADSHYAKTGGYYGHPFRGPSELFASTFAAFVMHPEELVNCINDPGSLESTRIMGKALYCFMRDNVFGGQYFSKEDPFRTDNADTLAASITEQDIDISIASALHDHTSCLNGISVAQKAAELLFCKAMKDDRYFPLLIASAKDKDSVLR